MFEACLDNERLACYKSNRRSIAHTFDSTRPTRDGDPTKEDPMSAVAAWDVVPEQDRADRSVGPTRPGRSHLRLVPCEPTASVCRPDAVAGQPALRGARRRVARARRTAALVVGVLAIVVVVGAFGAARAGASAPRVVVVQAGQTLSEIAVRELPDLPMGTAVAEIQIANKLNTSHVHAGQQLVIPAE